MGTFHWTGKLESSKYNIEFLSLFEYYINFTNRKWCDAPIKDVA